MKKDCGIKWFKCGKSVLYGAICIGVILTVVYLYWLVAHPIICALYVPTDIYEGVEIFEQDAYPQTEDTLAFKKFIAQQDFMSTGEVVYFYYGDNQNHDNPIHGEVCDVFAVDIQLSEQGYEKAKQNLIDAGYKRYQYNDGDHFVFFLPNVASGEKYETAFAINDEEQIIRCIMVTEAEDFQFGSDIIDVLSYRSALSFE